MLATLAAFVVATSASKPPPPNPCMPASDCRWVGTLTIATPGRPLTVKVEAWTPFLSDRGLLLFSGEEVTLTLDGERAQLKPQVISSGWAKDHVKSDAEIALERKGVELQTSNQPETVYTITGDGTRSSPPQPRTIRFSAYQVEGHPVTILHVENGFRQTLDYKAHLVGANGAEASTTVCRVEGIPMTESWSDPIIAFRLSDFALIANDLQLGPTLDSCD